MAWSSLLTLFLVSYIQVPGSQAVCKKTPPAPTKNFKAVCYPHVGCFDNRPPFTNTAGDLPYSPEKLDVGYRLFTRQNPKTWDTLNYTDSSLLKSTHFDPSLETKFVIHGFTNNGDTPWVNELKDGLLKRGDFNVITVDWGKGAGLPYYDQAVANLRMVATQIKLLLDIFEGHGAQMSRVHLIGHSLGAHMSGYVGLLMGSRIGRISGMDPAEPDFECLPTLIRLDPGDANFVDVVHTNGAPIADGGAGLFQQSGHVDFYVNGGKTQPGCKDGLGGALSSWFEKGFSSVATGISCSHARSHDIYIESINTHCPFTAFPCDSYDQFQKGACLSCGKTGCSSMGYFADKSYGRGKMFLSTRAASPFCGYQYSLTLQTSGKTRSTSGTLFAALQGTFGKTPFEQISPTDEQLGRDATLNFVATFTAEVGTVTSIKLKYEKKAGGWFGIGAGQKSFGIQSASVLSAETGSSYELCKGEYLLKHQVEEMIPSKDPTGKCPP